MPSAAVIDYDEDTVICLSSLLVSFKLSAITMLSYQPEQDKRWVVVAPPGAGENGASILLARAATPEQERFIGNQAGAISSPRT